MALDHNVLKQIGLFQSLTASEIEELSGLLTLVKKAAGETFFLQGEKGTSLYFVRKGRVKFTFKHDTGDAGAFEEIGPGTFFGEVALFSIYGEHTATAEAAVATEAFELTRGDLINFVQDRPAIALHLLGGMAERLRRSGLQLQHSPIRNLNKIEDEQLTPRDRVAQWVARFAGSPTFVGIHGIVFGSWIAVNAARGRGGFDPFPFHLLALWIGVEAMLLSCFVLMNQYREDKAQSRRNNEEFKINQRAERETAYLHVRLDKLKQELIDCLSEGKGNEHKPDTAPH